MNATHNITLSDNAAKRITALTTEGQEKGKILRIAVEGGGCFGFQYKYDFVDEIKNNDVIIKNKDSKVIIDDISMGFMKDSIIDYIETLGSAAFEIKNPNSKSGCGCGNSFSV